MNDLRAIKMLFVNRTSNEPQHLGSDGFDDKTNTSEVSSDNVEAGFCEICQVKKPGLARRFAEYARRRKTSVAKWSSSQPRSVWACVITFVMGTVIILVLTALLIYFNIHLRKQIPRKHGSPTQAKVNYPTDFSRDIRPIPCHSHNDYSRKVLLYDALAAGCTGVEADVWLTDNDLLVGHTTSALTFARSLTSLYIDPLMSILTRQNPPVTFQNTTNSIHPSKSTTNSAAINGVFETKPAVSLTLLIDIKSKGTTTLPVILEQLQPLRSRGYLTYFNGSAVIPGPITVVGTGNTPFDLLTANTTYRDMFYDAPLDQLWENDKAPSNASLYTAENSYYASVNFGKAIGKTWLRRLAPSQVDLIQEQAAAAAKKGLKARYWDTPSSPTDFRDRIWDLLEKEGVGMLNVDDLTAASRRNWGG